MDPTSNPILQIFEIPILNPHHSTQNDQIQQVNHRARGVRVSKGVRTKCHKEWNVFLKIFSSKVGYLLGVTFVGAPVML